VDEIQQAGCQALLAHAAKAKVMNPYFRKWQIYTCQRNDNPSIETITLQTNRNG